MTDERLPRVNLIWDNPVRRLMEIAAENKKKLSESRDPDKLNEQQTNAANTAVAVLAADPAIGPAEVIYIGPNADVPDMRYLIVLFQGERAFLFDRIEGRTTIVELDDRGLNGDERLAAKLESAKAQAAKARLSKVYVVKHEDSRFSPSDDEAAKIRMLLDGPPA
jgi:hypothetical protein